MIKKTLKQPRIIGKYICSATPGIPDITPMYGCTIIPMEKWKAKR